MGPPAFAGGNVPGVSSAPVDLTLLQWGHRLSPVETRTLRQPFATRPGFNGATGFRRWKHGESTEAPVERRELQWGHRLSPVETAGQWRTSRKLGCFNGATGFRRWKPYHYWGSMGEVWPASMGPPAFAGGNQLFRRGIFAVPGLASMGPPAFAGGNGMAPTVRDGPVSSFNGATGFRRWKPLNRMANPRTRRRLQWGHRLSPVETRRTGMCAPLNGCASMGPPAFAGGNVMAVIGPGPDEPASMGPPAFAGGNSAITAAHKAQDWLQWGHRLSPVETRGSGCQRSACRRFNGATGFRRWKRETARRPGAGATRASMGPPAFAGGNRVMLAFDSDAFLASMGPPAFAGGNTARASRAQRSCGCFNGATGFRRWKLWISMSCCPCGRSFNGATGFRRWKPAGLDRRNHCNTGFNGATGFRRWKRHSPRDVRLPRPSFNGATGFRRWKRQIYYAVY